jgi:dipeptidyl-peptidase-4
LSFAQKEITVKDIWQNYTFYDELLPNFNFQKDGKHYIILERNRIKKCDLTTGSVTKILFDASEVKGNPDFSGRINDYSFSEDEQKILIKTESEQIFRRSTKANFYVWDQKRERLSSLSTNGKQRYATFSPSADKVAFVRENNLFYKDLKSEKTIQITHDGKYNEIINGASDWVYEEEFRLTTAFEWSPDGKKIAFLKFNETNVKEFTMQLFRGGMYPENEAFKYPKVGEENAVVGVFIYDIEKGKTVKVDIETSSDVYIPKISWTKEKNTLCVFMLNRHQNELDLLLANAKTGNVRSLFKEKNKSYIELHNNLTFLEDGEYFLWTSEEDGFNHVYLYDLNGELKRQLTKGAFDVTDFYGYDEKRKLVYFQAAMDSPFERQVYQVDLNGGNYKKLTPLSGTNNVQFSSTFDYYINTHSTANTPPTYTVFDRKGNKIRVITDNAFISQLQKDYNVQPVEFFNFTTSESVQLNGWQIKPPNFDSLQQYPVFMYVYGGPGSQTVLDEYGGQNYWWFQMLAQKGYIVVSVDNRGTGGRGEAFKKMTYLQLGKYETIDQIEAAKYLANLPYADADRIGIFGWSYGAYVSLLSLFKGEGVFKSAIAVAPVANWKWYDTVFTERYMRTLEENPEGYSDNAPINFVDNMKGELLLVHGMGDDNVHFQNTVELTNALIRADKQFDTYFYPNRNHSIYGANARHHLYVKMTNFLLENL